MRWRIGKTGFWVVTAVAILAIAFGVFQYRQNRILRLREEANRQRAFFNLIAHVENMEGNLAKARAASTVGQKTTFLTGAWSHSQAAQENISQIGITQMDLSGLQKFIAQVGDYCHVLSQKTARGDVVTPKEWDELSRLETSVKDLARALSETGMRAAVTGAKFTVAGLTQIVTAQSPTDETLFRGFSEIDSLVQSVPSPTYDGPFSERSLASKSLARPGPEITQAEAFTKCAGFLHPKETYASHRVESVDGTIPAFIVTAKRSDGSEVSCSVAKKGGYILWAVDQKGRGAPKLDIASARSSAEAFLVSKGFSRLKETGWRKPGKNADRIVFTFASTETLHDAEGTRELIVYPDMVKVEVGLDTGEIIGFDQTAYLTNNVKRILKAPLYSEKEAKNVLKSDLKVLSTRLTVIPSVPGREIMAWEFKVQNGQDTYLVYINAMTGKEETVLQMITDDTGSMTM